ncbi:MAG: UvrD-helicase domain-containing protein [Phycisphaerae bacterium]
MDLLKDLNEPQRQAVCHVDGPLLVLAGAGSGKTRVITRRVAYLISRGVAPWQILAITFTNKAAGEMRQRVEALGCPRGATVATFHALCARLLREFAAEAGLQTNFSIYDSGDQARLVKAAIEKLDLKNSSLSPAAVLSSISRIKNELQTPRDYAQKAEDPYHRRVAEIYNRYQQSLAANNALDFDDLLVRMACLLRDRPEMRRLLGQRYRYILVDEYQDTNHAQYLLAHGIALEHENICVTGDPDQSIYAWRGADINNILEFEADYPNATVIRLEENYRSTKAILAGASRLISHNTQRKDKSLWTRREGGEDIRVTSLDDEHAEAAYVARAISTWHSRGKDYSDVAVFYRVNALSRVVEEALLRSGIPYRIARGVEFYNRKEIKDVLAYLKALVNPSDDLSTRRIINTPPRGIGETTIDKMLAFAAGSGISLLEACGQTAPSGLSAATGRKVAAFAQMMTGLAKGLDRPVRAIIEDVLRVSGMEAMLKAGDEEDLQAKANIDELISAASEFDATGEGGTLADYLHQVSLVSDSDHFEGGGGAVTLMTLHAAKGLEFPRVFIIGCEDGLLPFQRANGNNRMPTWRAIPPRELEEERRLAFVGMTRAQDELTLTAVRRRMLRGQSTSQTPSPFLEEIGTEMVTVEDATTPPVERPARPRGRFSAGGFYADAEDRAAIEAMEEAPVPPEFEHLREGCMVRHPTFGGGKVVRLTNRWPETRVVIDFQQFGRKTLVLRLARLELM